MTFVLLFPTILSFLVLAAHFLRSGSLLLVPACLAMCFLLLVRSRWVARVAQVVLILAAVEWVCTVQILIASRMDEGRDWLRAAIILWTVAAFNLMAAFLFQMQPLLARYAGAKLRKESSRRTAHFDDDGS